MDENVVYLLKVLEIALIAGVKFAFAPFEAERQGFNFRDAFIITTSGGCAGILAFSFVGEVLVYSWRRIIRFFRSPLKGEPKPKRKFTWMNKFIVRTKMRFGLFGLLFVTPAIISIPVGTLVINHFYRRKKARNILLLIVFLISWSVVLNIAAQYIKPSNYLPH